MYRNLKYFIDVVSDRADRFHVTVLMQIYYIKFNKI